MKFTLASFLRSQFVTLPPVDFVDLTDRVVVVTGSSGGLGYEAAKTLARFKPSRLILAVRDTASGTRAAQEIFAANGGKGTVPEVWELDLGRLQSVKDFAGRVNRDLERLDVVISNAEAATANFVRTVDGFESTSQVNNIANSLLSVLLLPKLQRSARLPAPSGSPNLKPHLSIVTSHVHSWIHSGLPGMKEDRKDTIQCFQEEALFVPRMSWITNSLVSVGVPSVAVNVLNALTLANLAGPNVIVNSVNPGFSHPELVRENKGITSYISSLLRLAIARSTEVGSRNIVWAGTHETPSGAYVHDCAVHEPSDFCLSPEGKAIGAGIWEEMKVIWKEKVGVDADLLLAGATRT